MLMKELVDSLKADNSDVFQKLDRHQVNAIANAVLGQVRKQIDTAAEGKVRCPVLGTFIVKQVVRVKDGKEETVRQVRLLPRPQA